MLRDEILSGFSEDFEIPNEDWNESEEFKHELTAIAATKGLAAIDHYTSNECLLKISDLRRQKCICKNNICDSFCTKTSAK